LDLGNGFGLHLSDENKATAMAAHKKLDTPVKLRTAKQALSVFFRGHSRRGGNKSGRGCVTKASVRNGAARQNAKNHLIGYDGFPGSGFVDHLLCNHINVMGELSDSKDLVAVNSVYITPDQLHGDSDFVCIDTEWSQTRWGYGPDGYITEFGAADAGGTVLVTGLQPIPPQGREMTKKTMLVVKRRCYRTNRPPLAARSCPPPSPLVWSQWVAPQHSSAMVRCPPLSRQYQYVVRIYYILAIYPRLSGNI
jgi:hypothetical protein